MSEVHTERGGSGGRSAPGLMGTIVVGIDGSENSHDALAWAVAEAKLRGARS